MDTKITLNQIGLYNPQRANDEVVEALFIVRQNQFNRLIEKIKKEKTDSIPQHYLIIAQRGMGKTTLLKRIEVELRKEPYKDSFVPLLFPEEQYNVKNLAEFWLNSLDALADTLELEKKQTDVLQIDKKVEELSAEKDDDILAKKAYQFLKEITNSINRRPVLLIDNINLIFDRLTEEEQFKLRAWLTENGAPIIIGASSTRVDGASEYEAPFYDAFQIQYLERLKFEELISLLQHLAVLTQSEEIIPNIHREIARLKTLHQLTGGNPRTAVMLFRLIVKGFSKDINDDLEALLDEATPIYKARFEELSTQMQVIIDAIALHWEPITLEQLRAATRYENGQLSPQLKRLVEIGWIEKTNAYKAKGSAYQISERFFNIWFLMRRSSRRQKREIYCLSKFLEVFYGDDISMVAKNSLLSKVTCLDHLTYNLALCEAVKDINLKEQLRSKIYDDIKEFRKTNPDILNQHEVFFDFTKDQTNKKLTFLIEKLPKNEYIEKEYINLKEELEQAVLLEPKNAKYWGALALTYEMLEKYQEALAASKNAIELQPEKADNWIILADILKDLKNYPEALTATNRAVELESKNAKYWNNLAIAYGLVMRNQDALKASTKAIQLEPGNAEYLDTHANVLRNLKKYQIALKTSLKVVELEPENAEYWNNLAITYGALEKFKESLESSLKAIQLEPASAYNWYTYGLTLAIIGNYNKALVALEKATDIEPENSISWDLLGVIQSNIRMYSEAKNSLSKAIKLDDKNHSAWNSIGNLYLNRLYDYEKAKNAFEKVLEITPEDISAKINLITLYRDYFNNFDSALRIFENIKEYGDYEDSYFLHATLFELYKHNKGIATEFLEKVLSFIENGFSEETQDDWWRFGATTTKLGYNKWLLNVLKEKGFDIISAPYFIAIEALAEKDTKAYLNSKAVEIREPAKIIVETMKKYM